MEIKQSQEHLKRFPGRGPEHCFRKHSFNRTEPSAGTCTFKEVTFVPSPGPDVDDGVYVLGGDALPAGDDADGVPVACPVVPVFIQPVPAVAEKVGAEPQRPGPAMVVLSANPVERSVKRAFA